jgi:hypothetical protein
MGIRCLQSSQPDLRTFPSRQDHVGQFDLGKFPEDLPRLVSETCVTTQSTQGFPKDIGEETDQNMRLNTFVFLMPYGSNTQITFVDPKSILRLRQLNVGFP